MEHRIVAALGPPEWSSSIGKKGSETSFATYGIKRDDAIVSVLAPSKYPDKIWSLLFPLQICDEVLLRIDRIDRDLGEILIALDLFKKERGFVSVSDEIDQSLLSRILKDNIASSYAPFDPDPALLREWLFTLPVRDSSDGSAVMVDQAFAVRGVGTVALGFVSSGKVSKHQELEVNPGAERTQVRSIQVHDKDVNDAPNGARVGLALKNLDPEDLPRGSILTEPGSGYDTTHMIKARIKVSPLWRGGLEPAMRLHANIGLQFVPCQLKSVEKVGDSEFMVVSDLESPVWSRPGCTVALVSLDSKTFRIFASGETI